MNIIITYPENCGGGQQSYTISLIRLISLVFILTCHIQQYLDIELAWWFNVGVQIFLCISGFLYGQKDVGEVTEYYKRRFRKILIPYYIVFVFFSLLEFIFLRDVFNKGEVANGLLCIGTIKGGEHLWFIRYILLCYILTPLLQAYRNKVRDEKTMWIFAIVTVVACSVWYLLFNSFYKAAWISCYVMGYSLGVNEKEGYVKNGVLLVLIGIVATLGNGIQIYCNYIAHISLKRFIYFCEYNHTFLGIFLFLLFKSIIDRIQFAGKCGRVLDITDKYSYETYLVHQFFILGPFTLMELTPIIGLNIVIICICILISAWLLKKAEIFIQDKVTITRQKQ